MPISYVGSGSAGLVNGTTIIVPAPQGAQESDLLILVMMTRQTQIAWPNYDGWTLVRYDVEGTHFSTAIYYRVAEGSEPLTYSFDIPQVNQRSVAGISAFREASHIAPVLVSAALPDSTVNLTVVAPSVTVSRRKTMLVAAFSTEFQGDVITPLAPLSLAWLEPSGPGQTNAGGTVAVGYQFLSSTGATGTRSASKQEPRHDLGQVIVIGSAVHLRTLAASTNTSSRFSAARRSLLSISSATTVSTSAALVRYRRQRLSTYVAAAVETATASRQRPFKASVQAGLIASAFSLRVCLIAASTSISAAIENVSASRRSSVSASVQASLIASAFSLLVRRITASASTDVISTNRVRRYLSFSSSVISSAASEAAIIRERPITISVTAAALSENAALSRERPFSATVDSSLFETSLSFIYRLIAADTSSSLVTSMRVKRTRPISSPAVATISSFVGNGFQRFARLGSSYLSASLTAQSDFRATRLAAIRYALAGVSTALALLRSTVLRGSSSASASSENDHQLTRFVSMSTEVISEALGSPLRLRVTHSAVDIQTQSAASMRRHPASPVNTPSVDIVPVAPRVAVTSNRRSKTEEPLPSTKLGEREVPPSSEFVAPLDISDNYGGR